MEYIECADRSSGTDSGIKIFMRHIALLLLLAVALAASSPAQADRTAVWFCPPANDFVKHGAYLSSQSVMELFEPESPWKNAAARVDVFKTSMGWILNVSDADLRKQIADLKRRKIALAVECGVLTPTNCGQGIEGYKPQGLLLATARRIRDCGGDLSYIAMDEPIDGGVIYTGPGACHGSVQETVANAAVNIKALWREFPDVQVGDIECINDYPGLTHQQLADLYGQSVDAFHAALGRPLAFFHADIAWGCPDYLDALACVRTALAGRNVPFGIIYNGSRSDIDDRAWLESAACHMATIESALGAPSAAIFQSWNHHPRKLLPETNPDSFTSLIDRYFGDRTRLSLAATGHDVTGRLTTDQGRPIPSVPLNVSLHIHNSHATTQCYKVTGNTPADASNVILGIRVNTEGGAPGRANLSVSNLSFEQPGTSIARCGFATKEELSAWTGLSKAPPEYACVQNNNLLIAAGPSQTLVLNSKSVRVSPAAPFSFEVNAAIPSASAGTGSFVLVFLSDGGKEAGRVRILFDTPEISIGPATTDGNGKWRAAMPSAISAGDNGFRIDVQYAGDIRRWPTFGFIEEPVHP